jgi:hypothetical protein
MKKTITTLLVLAAFSSLSSANESHTELESVLEKTGVLVVKGYENMGVINGLYNGSIIINVKDFAYADKTAIHKTGISISIREIGKIEKEATSYVDHADLEDLISGINSLLKATKAVTYLKDFEASYKTKGGFEVIVFNKSNEDLGVLIKVSSPKDGDGQLFMDKKGLNDLKQIIQNAKEKIKR